MGWFDWLFTPKPKPTPPAPAPPRPLDVRLSVWTPDGQLSTAGTATLTLDQDGVTYSATPAPEAPRWLWTLPAGTTLGWGAWLRITGVAGMQDVEQRVILGADLPDLSLTPALPTIQPLVIQGPFFFTQDGRRWRWRGISGFRLLEWLATGNRPQAERFLAWAAAGGCTLVRVFTMARYMFPLAPDQGRAVLDEALTLAAQHGLYLEVVALADTRSYTFDHRQHVRALGDICARHPNALLEVANEPIHQTQLDQVGDPAYLESLGGEVDPQVLVALGAAHGGDDESRAFIDGDYVTVHGDRDPGDDNWRMVRHTNEQRALQDDIDKPVINDEPSRDMPLDRHVAMGILCAMHGLGDTFHYAAGRDAIEATGGELDALRARVRGWQAIPWDWAGTYQNAGWAQSPVKGFVGRSSNARAYSSVNGGEAYTLTMAVASLEWRADWRPTEVLREGDAVLYYVTR